MLDDPLDPRLADLRGVLGSDLIGLHLYGSFVSGGFDPGGEPWVVRGHQSG